MVISKISLDCEKEAIAAMEAIRTRWFWSGDFLKSLDSDVRLFTHTMNALWFLGSSVVFMGIVSPVPPAKFICNEMWPAYLQNIFKLLIIVYTALGYFIGNAHVVYYGYTITHCCFQTGILRAYLRRQMKSYKNLGFKHKFYSGLYQQEIREVLVVSIKQYQAITMLFLHKK